MNATRLSLAIAGLSLAIAVRIGVCQESSNSQQELRISVPQESHVDDEAWQRISHGYAAEKSAFVRSLVELDASQIDYSRDTLADIQHKRESVSRAFGVSAQAALARMTNPALPVDYLRVAWEVVPRLTGRVVKVGKGQTYETIAALLPDLKTGDRVDLDAGIYSLTFQNGTKLPSDVAVTGRGSQDTTLIFPGDRIPMNTVNLERWRFANMRINTSANNPFPSPLRQAEAADAGGPLPSGSIHLQRCEFTGVSRGALTGGTLLIEGCAFRGEKEPFGGELFVFSGPQNVSAVYLRNCEFENVRDFSLPRIVHEPIVLDRCRCIVPKESERGGPPVSFYEAQIPFLEVLMRSSTGFNAPRKQTFEYAIDDRETVRYVLGQTEIADPRIIQLSDSLKLVRNPLFWIGLLRHADDGIRREAAKQVKRILSIEVVVPPEPVAESSATTAEISAAIEALDSNTYAKREEARQKLIEIGEPAVEALRLIQVKGTLEQQHCAEQILRDRDAALEAANLPEAWENEYGRISQWYAAERGKLTWDEAQGAYVAR
jgi:hypothetical protein